MMVPPPSPPAGLWVPPGRCVPVPAAPLLGSPGAHPSPGQPLSLPGSPAPLRRDWEEAGAGAGPGVWRRRVFAGLCRFRAQPRRCCGPRGTVPGMGAACRGATSCGESSGKASRRCERWHCSPSGVPKCFPVTAACAGGCATPGTAGIGSGSRAGRDGRVAQGREDVGSPLLGLAGHPRSGGLSLWATHLVGPATEPDAPGAACRCTLRTVQPPRPWLLAAGEPKRWRKGYIPSFFFFP